MKNVVNILSREQIYCFFSLKFVLHFNPYFILRHHFVPFQRDLAHNVYQIIELLNYTSKTIFKKTKTKIKSVSGHITFTPPGALAIFLHSSMLYNNTIFLNWGHNYTIAF